MECFDGETFRLLQGGLVHRVLERSPSSAHRSAHSSAHRVANREQSDFFDEWFPRKSQRFVRFRGCILFLDPFFRSFIDRWHWVIFEKLSSAPSLLPQPTQIDSGDRPSRMRLCRSHPARISTDVYLHPTADSSYFLLCLTYSKHFPLIVRQRFIPWLSG
jgi:hypothetical protein